MTGPDRPISMFGPDFTFAFDDWLAHPAGLGALPAERHGAPVAVIGAGVAGIVAAYELMKLGLRPVLYESGQLGGRLRSQAFEGTDGVIAELGGMRFPVSSCVPGWAMTDGQPVIIADVLSDQRAPRNLYHPTFVRALAMTPVGARPCAAIGAYWAVVGRPPRPAIEALKAFADSVATLLPRLIEAARR